MFPIVDAEVTSDVCPLFFRLGEPQALAQLCADAGFDVIDEHRIAATLAYVDAEDACDAAFAAGPVALAWSRFDDHVRARVRRATSTRSSRGAAAAATGYPANSSSPSRPPRRQGVRDASRALRIASDSDHTADA